MALRSSFTRVFGAVIPSAWANSIRDHLVTIATSDDVSSDGQLCFNTATNRLVARIGGTAIPIAGDMPRAKASTVVPIAAGSGGNVTLNWTTEDYDTQAMFTPFASRLTAPFTGMYLVNFRVSFASAANGVRAAWAQHNLGVRYGEQTVTVGATAYGLTLSGASEVYMVAGEYVECVVFQDTGAALNVQTSPTNFFAARFLGPT